MNCGMVNHCAAILENVLLFRLRGTTVPLLATDERTGATIFTLCTAASCLATPLLATCDTVNSIGQI